METSPLAIEQASSSCLQQQQPHEELRRRVASDYPKKLLLPCSLLYCLINLLLIALEFKQNTYVDLSPLGLNRFSGAHTLTWHTPIIVNTCVVNLFYGILTIISSKQKKSFFDD
jgi:hypothetical protein